MSSPSVPAPVGGVYYPPYYSTNMSNTRFNPTMAVVIIVIIAGCFVLGFMSVFIRRCMSGEPETISNTRTPRPPSLMSKCRGLDKEAVDALPLIHSSDLDEKVYDLECPVCLTEFEPEDTLRLLPPCKHVFHQECIDAWFDAHSTCPLCRANLIKFAARVAKEKDSSSEQGSMPEPEVATVPEAPESGDSVIEFPPTGDAPREDSTRDSTRDESQPAATVAPLPPGSTISREDSLNSARGTLSRNSQSFKRAARGVTASERAESLGAGGVLPSPKPPPPRGKPPLPPASTATSGIRRSSSLGTDIIALRMLLMGNDQNGTHDSDPSSPSRSYRLRVAKSEIPPSSSGSGSWFTRTRSMDLATRDRNLQSSDSNNSVAVDLESGKPAPAPGTSTSKGESSAGAAPERAWSDRWNLASLRGAMFPLSRSSSDIPNDPHFPV